MRHWNTLLNEINSLREKYPRPPATKYNKYPGRVPVELPRYTCAPVAGLPSTTALMGTPTACKRADKLAARWQRQPKQRDMADE